MTIVIDGTTGISGVDGTASNPSYEGTDSNTGIFFPAADTVAIGTGGSERMRIDTSGNVGIGTSSPAASLSVVKQTTALSGTGNSYGLYMYPTSSGLSYIDAITGSTGNTSLGFRTYNNGTYNEMRMDSSGNVGIGTSSPGKKLDVFNSGTTTTDFVVRNGTVSLLSFVDGAAAYTGTGTNHPLLFTTNNTERARITSGGDLLVGTTSTAQNTGVGIKLLINESGNNQDVVVTNQNSTSASAAITVYSTGASAYRFYVTMDGKINCTSTTIAAISDIRLKENIQDLDVGLDAIMALKPRKFDWKEGKGKDIKGDRGWIAQEFEQVFPDMISTWRDEPPEGEEPYKAVGADLIPVLTKAIQEQQAMIDEMKAEIAALKAQP